MKKVIVWLLVLALTTAISIGATLAYLTDTDEDVNVMILGNVKIDQLEYERVNDETADENAEVREFHDNKPLYPAVTENGFDYTPGDSYVDWDQIGKDGYTSEIWNPEKINNELDKMVFVKNKGSYEAYVRTLFAFEAGNYETLNQFQSMMHLNLNEVDFTWTWLETPVTIGESTYFIATATYNKVLEPGALTEISLSQIALDKTATNEDVEAFGETYQILVKTQAIQAAGFDTAAMALDDGFGIISATNIPWENDVPTKGVDVFTAVNYLNGETEQITKKVRSIVFGLTSDYTDVAMQNKGTLVDVEQDIPAYAYYVPNGSNYDVYVLSNDTIYAPTDCSNLCNGMSNLVVFDSSNLDFSRTTSMYRMLRDCNKLSILDVSDWDTSKVTNMRDLFRGCKAVPSLEVSDWDVSKVETMVAMFQDCVLITDLDLNSWDVSNVKEAIQMFNRCSKLSNLQISEWNPKNLQDGTTMFQSCLALKELDLSKWNTSSLVKVDGMFNHCEKMTSLNVSTWDVSNVQSFHMMFQACYSLPNIDVSQWNTSSASAVSAMFFDCRSLETVNVGNWNVSNVTNFKTMFVGCLKLESIEGLGNWDTSNGKEFDNFLNECTSLKEVDLSGFNTANATNLEGFFDSVKSLEKLIVGENFSCDANGKLGAGKKTAFPAPANVEGADGKWYDAETGVGYSRTEIPQGEATYVAVPPATNP